MLRLLFPYYENRVDDITYCNRECNEFRDGKYGCGKTVDLATADIHPFAKIAKGCCGRSGFIVCNYSCYNWCYYLLPYMV